MLAWVWRFLTGEPSFAERFFDDTRPLKRTKEAREKRLRFIREKDWEQSWQKWVEAFGRELESYLEPDLMELYMLLELSVDEGWPQVFTRTIAGRFLTFLHTIACRYFDHEPNDDAHIAGGWSNILYATHWLTFSHTFDFSMLANLPRWYSKHPTREWMQPIDAVCKNKKAMHRISNAWKESFELFCESGKNVQQFRWWGEQWFRPSWVAVLREKDQ